MKKISDNTKANIITGLIIGGCVVAVGGVGYIAWRIGKVDGAEELFYYYTSDPKRADILIDKSKKIARVLTAIDCQCEDELVTILSKAYDHGNPDPDTLNVIISKAKMIFSLAK